MTQRSPPAADGSCGCGRDGSPIWLRHESGAAVSILLPRLRGRVGVGAQNGTEQILSFIFAPGPNPAVFGRRPPPQAGQVRSFWLSLRFALREMRGGLRGFYVFITTIALGCMAIAGVSSLSASLADGLARQGQVILGGDLSFTLIQREATPTEMAFLQESGRVSTVATMRAMARTAEGKATLVEMKSVDDAYPLFGQAE